MSTKKLFHAQTAEKFHAAAMCFMLSVMVIAIFYQVISRYIFNLSLVWAEELARGCFIWMVLLVLSFVERNDEPIRITILRDMLPLPVQVAFNRISMVFSFVFSAICTYYGFERVSFLIKSGQIAPGLQISMAWFYLAIPVGFLLTSIAYLLKLIQYLKPRLLKGRG